MSTDHFIRAGLTTQKMAEFAEKCRQEFDIVDIEFLDIIGLIEFKMPEAFPGFRFLVKADSEFPTDAVTEPHNNRIIVKESVYIAACQGDLKSRYTLAHEVGHYLLHKTKNVPMHRDPKGSKQNFKNMNSMESAEDQADMFARHFLAPPRIAYKFLDNPKKLSEKAGIPFSIAKGNITLAKRQEMRSFIPFFHKKKRWFEDQVNLDL